MSKAIDIADAMAARINAIPGVSEDIALVDRQKNIQAEVATRVNKSTGAAITILYEGFSNSATNASGLLTITRRYSVSLYARPVLQTSTAMPADDLIEEVARRLHDWEPEDCEINVTGCDMRPDKTYLIYDLDVEVLSRL